MNQNQNRVRKYHVIVEAIFDPEAEIQDVMSIEILVCAKNMDEAIERTWETLAVKPNKYEIVHIDAGSRFNNVYSRCSERF